MLMYLYSFSKYVHSVMDTADDLSFAFMAECAVASHQTESGSPETAAPTGDSSFEFFPTAAAAAAGQRSPSLSDVLAAADDHGAVLLKKKSGRGSGAPKRVTFMLAEPASRSEREENKGMPRRDGGWHRWRRQKQKGLFGFVVSACRECQAVEPSKHAVSNRRIIAV